MSKKRSNEQQPRQAKINLAKADDFRQIYANWIQTAYTPFDISLLVGQATPVATLTATTNSDFDVLQTARVTMTPSEAKLVSVMLFKAVHDWEEMFGKIVIPAQAIPPELALAIQTIGSEKQQSDVQDESKSEGV